MKRKSVSRRRFLGLSAGTAVVGGAGWQSDSEGLFYRFDLDALQPNTEYTLQLTLPSGKALCDSWPLKTFRVPASTGDNTT